MLCTINSWLLDMTKSLLVMLKTEGYMSQLEFLREAEEDVAKLCRLP
jgi:hypothetical protein